MDRMDRMDRCSARLRAIETHLKGVHPHQESCNVGRAMPNECAATCTLSYGRPAAPDTLFARPVQEQPALSYFEALGVASQHVPEKEKPISASEQQPPLFARPQITLSGESKTSQRETRLATDSSTTKLLSTGQHFAPRAFIQENEFGYVLHAVLPGVKAKDIVAELLSNQKLLISGVRFSFQENGGQLPDAMKIYHNISSDPFILSMKEEPILPYGRFKISWKLPEDADPESLRAKVEDGCLWVSISKRSQR